MSTFRFATDSVYGEDISALLPILDKRANKGSCGRVLVICGSYDPRGLSMSGAAFFAAASAYRTGVGLVEIFTARKNFEAIAARLPEAVYSLYENEENFEDVCARVEKSLSEADAVVIGCGIGKSEMSRAILKTVLKKGCVPLLLDADALNIMSEDKCLWELLSKEQRARTVITPHAGEMMRLCGKSIESILSSTVETAYDFAREYGVICLLKDNKTVISDGKKIYINHSGNAGMASAGLGDLLSGIIGALLAKGQIAYKRSALSEDFQPDWLLRAAIGAYIHGLAGDLARNEVGEYSLMASDLLSKIPNVISKYSSRDAGKTNLI